MEMGYYTIEGDRVSPEQIQEAFQERRAVICWAHGDWKNIGTLMICATEEDADVWAERDTRGECYSMAEEVWCHRAESVKQAKMAAAGTLVAR